MKRLTIERSFLLVELPQSPHDRIELSRREDPVIEPVPPAFRILGNATRSRDVRAVVLAVVGVG